MLDIHLTVCCMYVWKGLYMCLIWAAEGGSEFHALVASLLDHNMAACLTTVCMASGLQAISQVNRTIETIVRNQPDCNQTLLVWSHPTLSGLRSERCPPGSAAPGLRGGVEPSTRPIMESARQPGRHHPAPRGEEEV